MLLINPVVANQCGVRRVGCGVPPTDSLRSSPSPSTGEGQGGGVLLFLLCGNLPFPASCTPNPALHTPHSSSYANTCTPSLRNGLPPSRPAFGLGVRCAD